MREDRTTVFGVLGLTAIVVIVLVLSTLLSFRGLQVPDAWDTLAGAAAGSIGTLLVARSSGRDEIPRATSNGSYPQKPPAGTFTRQTAPILVEEGAYKGDT